MILSHEILWFIGFNIFVIAMLILDLKVFHRKAHEVTVKEAIAWTFFWIALSLLFNLGIYFIQDAHTALSFLTGYLLEKSLSVDNLFVFLLIFSYFNVKPKYQHRVLFWGIIGALIMRALFIATGVALMRRFHWIIYVFGPFLIVTAIRMATHKEKEIHPEKNPLLRLFRRFMRVTSDYQEEKFFVKRNGVYMATPLFVVLLVIETTDVIFALDSIPAILAVTTDPFIVYSSNVFAILGLRAMFFALAGAMELFHYLNYGVAAILAFVGIKMMISEHYKIPIPIALGVVGGLLLISIAASLIWPLKEEVIPEPVNPAQEEDARKDR